MNIENVKAIIAIPHTCGRTTNIINIDIKNIKLRFLKSILDHNKRPVAINCIESLPIAELQ